MHDLNWVLTTESFIVRVSGPDGATTDLLTQLVYRLCNKINPALASLSVIKTTSNTGMF